MSVVIGPPSGSAAQYLDPVQMVRGLWRHRDLIVRLTGQEVAQRYRGSYLGIVWSFITPILMLAVYAFVFSIVFQARWGEAATPRTGEFALTLFAGLIPFAVFSEVLNRAPQIILSMPNYVKKVVFPLEILPVVAVGFGGGAVADQHRGPCSRRASSASGAASPFVLCCALAYLPLVFLLSASAGSSPSLGVYVRDIGHAIAWRRRCYSS